MLEYPSQASGIALRIAGSTDGVKGEANAEESPDRPVRDAVAEEVEEEPGCDHRDYSGGLRVCGSRRGQGEAGGDDSGDLQGISREDRKATENFSLHGRIHICYRLSGQEFQRPSVSRCRSAGGDITGSGRHG